MSIEQFIIISRDYKPALTSTHFHCCSYQFYIPASMQEIDAQGTTGSHTVLHVHPLYRDMMWYCTLLKANFSLKLAELRIKKMFRDNETRSSLLTRSHS